MPLQPADAAAALARPTSMDEFVATVLAGNPFERNRISDPSQMDCDVTAIHAAAFQRLVDLADHALHGGMGQGVLLLGSAGTGKSHLLSRLARWAAERQACFVFLHNIQVRPDDMNRYLLKCCVSRLAEDRLDNLHQTLLYRVVDAAIRKAAVAEKIVRLSEDNYREVYRRLSRRLGGEDAAFDVIFQFFFHASKSVRSRSAPKRADHARRAALAVRWLKGDLLDADEARQLDQKLRPDQDVCELGDDHLNTVLLGVARLARESDRPFMLCVDQADNMKHDQLSALAKSLHALIDDSQNLLVVLSGVREDMLKLIDDGVIHAAAADRLNHSRPIVIHRIKRSEARQVLRQRLAARLGDCESLPPACQPSLQDDDLFPLGSDWFERVEASSLELRPRDALTWASERWREVQTAMRRDGGPAWLKSWRQAGPALIGAEPTSEEIEAAIDRKVAEKLDEVIRARCAQPDSLPADGGNLLGLTTQLLEQYAARGLGGLVAKVVSQSGRSSDLVLHQNVNGRKIEYRVAFVVTGSKTSAAAHLRRLLQDSDAARRILVTDDDRAPLPLGEKGDEYLTALEDLGADAFTRVPLSFEQYAELDALLSVAGQARSGDLEIEPACGRIIAVSESQVIDSYHRHDRYRRHVLLGLLLTEG